MGVPSVTIMLHEIIKLLHYANANDPIIIRIGTSGGVGKSACVFILTDKQCTLITTWYVVILIHCSVMVVVFVYTKY